jgi:hypothetical protein
MQRGRIWIVLLVVLAAAAAGGAWYFFRPEVEKAMGQVEKALEPGPTITPIRDIVAAPSRFAGKEVTVQGAVTSTSEVVTSGGWTSRFYTLKGEGAEIVVLVKESLPGRGHSLTVTGVVAEATPKGKGLAPRLNEKQRAAGPGR